MLNINLLFFFFFILTFLGLTTAGQESSIQFQKLNHKIPPISVSSNLPVAISLSDSELPHISSSVLMAETWLRTFVFPHFPSTKITTIVVGNTSLCTNHDTNKFNFILLSLNNLFSSLKRWGLENQIKVSTLFLNDCFYSNGVEIVAEFIKSTNSSFTMKLPQHVVSDDEIERFVSTQIQKFGFLDINRVNLITEDSNQRNPISRKLFTAPSDSASPPEWGFAGGPEVAYPPEWGFAGGPEMSPVPLVVPASPPVGYGVRPCDPGENVGVQKMWCVAKPSVPGEILQQAMEYACGEGGGDCREIAAEGRCFNPDSLVAHASYAFNSYWQKNKRSGGSCSFGATAMLITSDPSFHNCRFVLS